MKIIDKYGRQRVTFGRAEIRLADKVVDLTNDGTGGQLDVTAAGGKIIRIHGPSIGVYIVNSSNQGIALYGGSTPSLNMLGSQVVGPRQPSVSDADPEAEPEDPEYIWNAFNDLLAKLRNHGLIWPPGT